FALSIGDVREQDRAPLVLRDAADELPAHQRVQLRVLVDGPVDADQETARLEIGQVLLQVEARAACGERSCRIARLVEHVGSSSAGRARLVSRFRSSQYLAAHSDANFGIKGTLVSICSWCPF